MKKLSIGLAAAMMLSMLSCTSDEQQTAKPVSVELKTITFTFGDMFTQHAMTRADVASLDLTDLWMFDYVGDELQQTVHQSSTDDATSRAPTMDLVRSRLRWAMAITLSISLHPVEQHRHLTPTLRRLPG